mmetsp:Transcript_34400/g.76416  ORF Transcript_34400/g.76416 Transcript_34400/m.76416 type:complete len:274 (-) Transcript_34400:817-1638(-)
MCNPSAASHVPHAIVLLPKQPSQLAVPLLQLSICGLTPLDDHLGRASEQALVHLSTLPQLETCIDVAVGRHTIPKPDEVLLARLRLLLAAYEVVRILLAPDVVPFQLGGVHVLPGCTGVQVAGYLLRYHQRHEALALPLLLLLLLLIVHLEALEHAARCNLVADAWWQLGQHLHLLRGVIVKMRHDVLVCPALKVREHWQHLHRLQCRILMMYRWLLCSLKAGLNGCNLSLPALILWLHLSSSLPHALGRLFVIPGLAHCVSVIADVSCAHEP